MNEQVAYAKTGQRLPNLPPPVRSAGGWSWVKTNLFSSKINTLLTVISVLTIVWLIPPVIDWAFINAVWSGTPADCQAQKNGACWAFVGDKGRQFIFGFYPLDEIWRPALVALILAVTVILLANNKVPGRKYVGAFLLFGFPVVSWFLLEGGVFGLSYIGTQKWGGFMLTVLIAAIGIIASLPLGILLALGRTSTMPIIRMLCVIFIEFWRGIPLIIVLFMAAYLLPLFFEQGVSLNLLLRAMVGVSLFSAAYMAEVIRGGLQSIPKGQYEGAESLGLNYFHKMRLIILPQTLKIVIPSIVNTFIGLFKDTTLVLIIGLFDFLGIIQAGLGDPNWQIFNIHHSGYAFCAFLFFVCCYGMSSYSKKLENKQVSRQK